MSLRISSSLVNHLKTTFSDFLSFVFRLCPVVLLSVLSHTYYSWVHHVAHISVLFDFPTLMNGHSVLCNSTFDALSGYHVLPHVPVSTLFSLKSLFTSLSPELTNKVHDNVIKSTLCCIPLYICLFGFGEYCPYFFPYFASTCVLLVLCPPIRVYPYTFLCCTFCPSNEHYVHFVNNLPRIRFSGVHLLMPGSDPTTVRHID